MKKFLYALLLVTLLTLLCVNVAFAQTGSDVIYSDLAVCINHHNIPSFVVDGKLVVAVDDLRAYGIAVESIYGGDYYISVSGNPKMNPIAYQVDTTQYGAVVGTATKDVVPVFINNRRIESYQLNGFTLIPAEELGSFGQAIWVSEQRVLKIWIDALPVKLTYDPPAVNSESLIYNETLEIVNAYRAVNEYEKALSAIDWTINNALGEDSQYFESLSDLAEEIAYITAINNINLALKGGNLENAVWNAADYLYYCEYGSPYHNALATRYAELKYQEASKNIAVHLKKGDYYSAYTTAMYAKSSISYNSDAAGGTVPYYEKLSADVAAICKAWRKAIGKSFVVVDTWTSSNTSSYKTNVTMKIVNLSDKPVIAFKTESDICDVFGELLSHYTLYCESTWLSAYGNNTYTWEVNYKNAKKINNLKVTQVVYE